MSISSGTPLDTTVRYCPCSGRWPVSAPRSKTQCASEPSSAASGTLSSGRSNRRWMLTIGDGSRSEEHTSELQSQSNLVCRLLLEKKIDAAHDGGVLVTLEIARDERLFGVIHDPLERSSRRALERGVHLLLRDLALQHRSEVDDRDGRRRDAEGYTSEPALELGDDECHGFPLPRLAWVVDRCRC